MTVRIITADVMDGLRMLPDESVHAVVTSPPYWGLRSYLPKGHPLKHLEIGQEPTLQEHIAKLVSVFTEVRRVLREDGTLWLNYGDMWASDGKWGGATSGKHVAGLHGDTKVGRGKRRTGLKPKDLCMAPHRLAIALQDDGWWVRQDNVWHKLNGMPESVRDRPTRAHEYVFLLTKREDYFYDQDAVLVAASPTTHARLAQGVAAQIGSARANGGGKTNGNMKAVGRKSAPAGSGIKNNDSMNAALAVTPLMRNLRSVWATTTAAFSEAHFATFPPVLAEICIKAGCPADGTVLDPFGGSGTVGLVADRLQRDAILIDLDPANLPMAEKRIKSDAPLFAEVAA